MHHRIRLPAALGWLVIALGGILDAAQPAAPLDPAWIASARSYSEARDGRTFLVLQHGEVIGEGYARGATAATAMPLASGTKSVTGVLALIAREQGLLGLDEPVAATIRDWRPDPDLAAVTIRDVLTLSSGLPGGGIGRPPRYAEALDTRLEHPRGERFQYGPLPFQVFGAVLDAKLAPKGQTVRSWAIASLFDPAGIRVGDWTERSPGQPNLPSGLALTARDWARFGELIRRDGEIDGRRVLKAGATRELFVGTRANPAYGLCWWLAKPVDDATLRAMGPLRRATDLATGAADLPPDIVMAAGAGGQRLYVIPSHGVVAVRQAPVRLGAAGRGFSDVEFLRRLLGLVTG